MSKSFKIEKGGINGIKYLDDEGKLHRTDGPALEWENGTKHWAVKGLHHRLDGPAIIWESGNEEYLINGEFFSKEQFSKHPDVLKYKMLQEAKQMLGIKDENKD